MLDKFPPHLAARMLAIAAEALSFAVSLCVGIPALWHVSNLADMAMVYLFVFACGALGARVSAMIRERGHREEFRAWARAEIAALKKSAND